MTSTAVFLSAGHSNTDPGATTSAKDAKGKTIVRREADIAVEMRNMVAFYLSQFGTLFEVDGHGTVNIPLKDAAKRMRGHVYGIEFHCNASASASATGAEVLCDFDDKNDVALSAKLSAEIAKALGIRDRGAKAENSGQHARLAFVQAGGVIAELFFISNPNDLAKWDARKWLAAKAVAEVLRKL